MGAAEKINTYKIKGVEVFASGKWNSDTYSDQDLHDMVSAFNNLKHGFRPYLKLGHDSKQKLARSSGLPSVGWVECLYVKGNKLYADFDYVPEKIYKLIESRAYRKVSCEIYWDLDVNGVKYPRVVGAVALLGAENPGVMILDDILGMYAIDQLNNSGGVFSVMEKQDTFKTYTTNFETNSGEKNMSEEKVKELEAQLEAQKKNYDLELSSKAELQKQLDESNAKIQAHQEAELKAQAEAKTAKVAQFVTELEAKSLISPSMKELVTELMSDKKEYTVKEKTVSKEDLLTEILALSKETAKVNFTESSKAEFGKKGDKLKETEEEISKFQKDNKCDYTTAYKAVMKSKQSDGLEEETEK